MIRASIVHIQIVHLIALAGRPG